MRRVIGIDVYRTFSTLATLAKVIRNQRGKITSQYPRHKLADDGQGGQGGQGGQQQQQKEQDHIGKMNCGLARWRFGTTAWSDISSTSI